ncbi:MAG: hypothetical protein J7M25_07340 [Deltaproteobacteria bacterium]|nr:hypothetical protein [Deltaproteobacteria bacterium]
MDTTTRQPSNHRIRPSKRRITSFAGLAAAILATSVLLGGCGDSTSKYAVTLTINKPADGSSIPDRMKFMKLTVLYQKEEGGSFCQITSFNVQTYPQDPKHISIYQSVEQWPWSLGMERGSASGGALSIIIEGFGNATSANDPAYALYRQILQTTIPSKGTVPLVLNIQKEAIQSMSDPVDVNSAWNPDAHGYDNNVPLFKALVGNQIDQWPTAIRNLAACPTQ